MATYLWWVETASISIINLILSVPDTSSAINLNSTLNGQLVLIYVTRLLMIITFFRSYLGIISISPEPISALGLNWNRAKVSLAMRFTRTSDSLLITEECSNSSPVFDPSGLIAPASLPLRLLTQEYWKQKISWDENLLYLNYKRDGWNFTAKLETLCVYQFFSTLLEISGRRKNVLTCIL